MSCDAKFTDELRERGYRVTPQRRVILHILSHVNTHLTPGEVIDLAQESLPGLTEATVYRTLEFLAQAGLAQIALGKKGKRAYEISERAHHHLLCRKCGHDVEISHARMENLFSELEEATDFQLLSRNHLTLMGLCQHCQ